MPDKQFQNFSFVHIQHTGKMNINHHDDKTANLKKKKKRWKLIPHPYILRWKPAQVIRIDTEIPKHHCWDFWRLFREWVTLILNAGTACLAPGRQWRCHLHDVPNLFTLISNGPYYYSKHCICWDSKAQSGKIPMIVIYNLEYSCSNTTQAIQK